MDICLSGRQQASYLQKADEIKLEYRDRKIIPDYSRDYPGARIIIEISPYVDIAEINWTDLENYNLLCNQKLYLCTASLEIAKEASARKIKFYCGYPIESDFELQGWINAGAAYARLGMPLFFDLKRVKEQYGELIKFRAVPNIAYIDNLPRKNGINGQWIRPEDLTLYSQYIDVIEFEEFDQKREQALYKTYVENKEWKGSLKLLITNLNAEGSNNLIPSEVGKARLSCRQVCAAGGACRICFNALKLANFEKLTEYKENLNEI